jgi:hypothetical protein
MARPKPRALLLPFLFAAVAAAAQQGQALHRAVAESPLTLGSAAAVVAALARLVPADTEVDGPQALARLSQLGFRLPRGGPESPIGYGDFALLVMQAFDLRGGIRYAILPTPASAFAELEKRALVPPGVYERTPLPGAVAVDMLHALLESRR